MADDIAIKVDHVSKAFKLPHEKQTSIKGALINLVHGGSRSYEEQRALNDVTFEIKKGEFFGIVGRNGSGKSTLLKMLAGIYTPTSGGIQVNGKLTPFIELGVGFNPELTGRENVFLNGALLGFNRAEMAAMYDDIVEFAELEKFMDQKLKNYSSGMQVRLAFSIAIRANSDILLLDEVLAVGDAAFQQKCFNYFEQLKRNGHTVVFVSHDMGAVRRFCTKAVYIKNGDLIAEGSAGDIADLYTVENLEDPNNAKQDGPELAGSYKVGSKVVSQSSDEIVFEIDYIVPKDEEPAYVGISLIKDGISIGEIITSPDKALTGKDKITYTLDVLSLNAGVYYLSSALFKVSNKELVAFSSQRSQFMVKGSDPLRGAAIKLKDSWDYK